MHRALGPDHAQRCRSLVFNEQQSGVSAAAANANVHALGRPLLVLDTPVTGIWSAVLASPL